MARTIKIGGEQLTSFQEVLPIHEEVEAVVLREVDSLPDDEVKLVRT